jgi:hypothetical protein
MIRSLFQVTRRHWIIIVHIVETFLIRLVIYRIVFELCQSNRDSRICMFDFSNIQLRLWLVQYGSSFPRM